MTGRTYRLGESSITVVLGDLLLSRAQVLVSSDDYTLSMGGGLSRAIREAAGELLVRDTNKLRPARLGDVVVSSAGKLGARYVFHGVTIGPDLRDMPADAIVRQIVSKALRMTILLGCSSIAFPVIGTGLAGIDFDDAAAEMAAALASALARSPVPLQTEIHVYAGSERTEKQVFRMFERHLESSLGLSARSQWGDTQLQAPDEAPDERRAQVYRMIKYLDERRDRLEAALMAALVVGPDTGDIARLRAQLEEVKKLRAGYELDLAAERAARPAANDATVFVSSTSQDLRPHRDSVRGAIERLGLTFVGMEEFAPDEAAPAELIRRRVEESRTYLGVIGMRYGHVEPGSGLSMTELEYRQAAASDKPMRIFLMHRDAPITPAMVETDAQSFAKLLAFRAHLEKVHTCGYFMGAEDLAEKALKALRQG